MEKICKVCGKTFEGRADKQYCSDSCRSSFHNQANRKKPMSLFQQIDHQLKLNRRILKKSLFENQPVVSRKSLLDQGFNPNYFTHYHRSNLGSVYLYVYEYGFLPNDEDGEITYTIVKGDPE